LMILKLGLIGELKIVNDANKINLMPIYKLLIIGDWQLASLA